MTLLKLEGKIPCSPYTQNSFQFKKAAMYNNISNIIYNIIWINIMICNMGEKYYEKLPQEKINGFINKKIKPIVTKKVTLLLLWNQK